MLGLKYHCSRILFFCLIGSGICSQNVLHLTPPVDRHYLILDMEIPRSVARQIHDPLRSGSNIPVQRMEIGDQEVQVKEIKTRGKSSAFFYRKSFNVQLEEAFEFESSQGKKKMKRFYLLAQAMDTHYFRNYFAFTMMHELKVAKYYFQYAELHLNGVSEGIYLLIERPYDVALKDKDAPMVIRRLESRRIDKEKLNKKVPAALEKETKKAFAAIPDFCKTLHGQALYDSLNRYLDLEDYFSWLAFNYWAKNGDYTDEVCYYVQPDHTNIRFGIVPWDFDDLLTQQPHEGLDLRNKRFGDAMIYSSEDFLDRAIAEDSVLYARYLDHFRKILPKMTNPVRLQEIFTQIYQDLEPLYALPANYEISAHDREPTDPKAMKENLGKVYSYLNKRTEEITRQLEVN
ncbi:MAG TPA: CotH kinase family protein [Saprospiraceae bacterium]|nr:CotH kinase family protein [Saprospiraceae bacterium]HPG08114.1 CotH kinase family protein [Saprospiraceae bacterium]HRV85964.1 CotH kinase family protein [Saprospiraceae bacterium]